VQSFPDSNEVLGRWLNPLVDIGTEMCYNILKETGKVVQRSTVRALTKAEWESDVEKAARTRFDKSIEKKLGPSAKPSDFADDLDAETPEYETYSNDLGGSEQRMPEADDYNADAFDKYLGAETLLALGDSMLQGIVKTRKRDADGNPIGKVKL
jgi:chromatin remodeling complex protein RSC6